MPILYRILAAIGVAAILFGAGWYFGDDYATDSLKAKYAKELAASLEQSRQEEQRRQSIFNQVAKDLTDAHAKTIADRDRIIARLHNDQNRRNVPQSSGTDCPRTDWRTLPAEMGAEIVRDIAKADEYREGLIGCYAALDSLQ